MKLRNKVILITLCSVLIYMVIDTLFLQKKGINKQSFEQGTTRFVGDVSCKNCHNKEFNDWKGSHHFKAMQVAADSTVEGNFNNAVYISDGVTSRFFKKDGKFIINTQGEDGKNHDYEVKYTFGFTPLQQYLVEFSGGRMQVTRASWDVIKHKWFHQYSGQKIQAGDWLHWTGNAQNWNTTCADCHSTNLQKNYSIETDTYHTTYSSINVSCESCHGAASNHIDYINGDYKKGNKVAGSMLRLPKNVDQITQINACAPCHARRTNVSNTLLKTDELLDDYIPEIPTEEGFYADGQVKEEDFIYTSFVQSKMFKAGVKCSNCHSPHSEKLVLIGNKLCLQCHQKSYNEPTHTFHKASTAGSSCVSCHMPGKYFMENDYRHDHALRVPRPDLSVKYSTPNACTNCHADKSSKWAADAIAKQYGPKRKYHYAEDLLLGSKQGANAEVSLLKLLKNTATPDIIKATAASYLTNIQTGNSLKALLDCLKDKDAQIRYRALRSLISFNPQEWINSAAPLLSDKVRAVRVAATDLFLTIPTDQLPPNSVSALTNAKNDLTDYLYSQADFAAGNIAIGDYYMRIHDNSTAEKFYLRGLKKDELMNLARLNLSVVYNLNGNNAQALQVLKTAEKVDPKNDRIYYNIALLYNEMKDMPNALINFEKAVQLKSSNPRLYYNYGLLLVNTNPKKAEHILQKGLTFSANDLGLNYALAYFYLRNNQPLKAVNHALVLKKLDPNNPEYSSIFSALKI